ncbi:hypothetical protein E2C01_058094 [Portunus trituberculatus]|uniref:Uncharacterized protein n=1 Tax=Portunus trituberculatus TaxID=210409 RepID=A0A5B7H296_PORTR|nr:hypothetical protein [Portunus trituberculatus]
MASSDPLHGASVSFSEETRVVMNALLARIVQLLANLLASPASVPARKEELEALLRLETVSAISECGFQPPQTPRDPFPGALHPANPVHHHDGE